MGYIALPQDIVRRQIPAAEYCTSARARLAESAEAAWRAARAVQVAAAPTLTGYEAAWLAAAVDTARAEFRRDFTAACIALDELEQVRECAS